MKRQKPALVRWDRIEAAYEIWAELGDIDRAPTWDEARLVARAMREEGYARHHREPKDIVKWLTERRAYSPYVDEVAIERVLRRRDWDDTDGLTDREYSILLDRLVEIVDRQVSQPAPIVPIFESDARLTDRTSGTKTGDEGPRWGRRPAMSAGTPRMEQQRYTFPDHHPVRQAVDQRRSRRDSRAQAPAAA